MASVKDIFHTAEFNKKLDEFIEFALQEDIGECDHTSFATVLATTQGEGRLLVKDNGVIAGIEVAQRIFKKIDNTIKVQVKIKDGAKVKRGDIAFIVKGPARSLLTGERLVLNCMQRMSGVATQANELMQLCKGTDAKVLDTRKTTPGIRLLEKWAVHLGGATNHRWGLYDMILIKDNHIECAGGVKQAIESTLAYLKQNKKKLAIEIEASSIKQLKEILATGGVQRILLDNFTPMELVKAIRLINGKYETEASGGITRENLGDFAHSGINYISVGALTHSVKSLDMSLKIFPVA